jgi:hypothetical protein
MENFIKISDLEWETAGPLEEASVLLETYITINSNNFHLLAFKVPLPYSNLETNNLLWETSSHIKDDHLLWNPEKYFSYINNEDNEDIEKNKIPGINSENNENITNSWKSLKNFFKQKNEYWRPSIIEGGAYYIFGYPSSHKKFSNFQNYQIGDDMKIKMNNNLEYESSYRIIIENTPCILKTFDLRTLKVGNNKFSQPLNDKSNLTLKNFDHSFNNFIDKYKRNSIYLNNGSKDALITPFDTTRWYFDFSLFFEKTIYSLINKKTAWYLSTNKKNIEFSNIFEEIKLKSSMDYMKLINNEGYICLDLDKFRNKDNFTIFDIKNIGLNGIIRKEENQYQIVQEKLFDDMFVYDNNVYLKPNNIFLNIIQYSKQKNIIWLNEIYIHNYESGLLEEPVWIKNLPILFRNQNSFKY